MRFLLVALLWLVILGGLRMYFAEHQSKAVVPSVSTAPARASGSYRLALTPTFSAEPDPFTLQTDTNKDTGVIIRINGQPVNLGDRTLRAGKVLLLEGLSGVNQGNNDIFVQASPPVTESTRSQGLRVQLFVDETPLLDTTLWSTEGALVSGTVPFAVPVSKEAAHDH
jgi:hypothetical protein